MKDFAPHQQALELKELGFDEPCFGYYLCRNSAFGIDDLLITTEWIDLLPYDSSSCKAPTYSQAFTWFREKYNVRHNIMDFIDDEVGIEWDYEIATIGTDLDENGNYKPLVDYSTDDKDRKFKTYEEAELACLNKLIEIVKDEK